ncbi:putative rnapii degradation factor def1 [Erysiphe necator]|uniref:RNA polymerase II degradation factor 1 n=1 Tax=Uncinula necator TaxID=52586 RepID=A0A0B1PCJ6_UNCNE|nr:putative rnapii degradation factor def1 [Erysiphe necator]
MSEVQTRPLAPRGRGSGRGGRGGSSGGRSSRANGINGKKPEKILAKTEEEGEVGQLKKLYSSQVTIIKEMFPDWTDEDIVFALRETDGNLELTVERITDGTISQWGEVSKAKKDRLRTKVKDSPLSTSTETISQTRSLRGGRAGFDSSRGGRGRGTDRGRGGKSRGASISNSASTRWTNPSMSTPSDDWKKPADETSSISNPVDDWDTSGVKDTSVSVKVPATIVADGVQKSWATLFATTPAPKKPTTSQLERPVEMTKVDEVDKTPPIESSEIYSQPIHEEPTVVMPLETTSVELAEADDLPPSNTLTEENVGHLPDTSAPLQTATVASTVASSWDHRGGAESSTPYNTMQQNEQQEVRTSMGFQNSTIKGNTPGRTLNYQRRVFDQEEAVRMPGNREVDRTAVQFGAFNLKDNCEEDVDGGREEAETRAQPPQHSPVAPRASLPPVHQQPINVSDSSPVPMPSVGLPAASLPTPVTGLTSPAPLSSSSVSVQQTPQVNGQFSHYSKFAQGGVPEKSYDTFNQQTQPAAQSSFDGYPEQQTQTQQHAAHSATFSSAPNDYSSYYAADPQQRNIYNSYYQQQFGSQHQSSQATQIQDVPASHHRSYNGYSGPPGESPQFQHSASHQPQSRYVTASEGHNSGHTTPNPISQAPQPGASNQASQPQAGHQPQVPGTFQYGHPYYSSPYYSAYMNQYPGYGTGNYPAGPYAAKAGIHQHYQGYNISPGPPYEQSVSPGSAAFGVSSIHTRDSAVGFLSESRTGSAQSAQTPQTIGGSAAFSTGHDGFSRGYSYQSQGQPHYGGQQTVQQNGDDVKPFNDSKTASGPNPSIQSVRPGSATNATPGNSAIPPQSQQASYSGYPAHLQQPAHNIHGSHSASQYGALGSTGLQHQASGQGHQGTQYGAYQGFGGGNYYSNSQQRGGWGGNYGH